MSSLLRFQLVILGVALLFGASCFTERNAHPTITLEVASKYQTINGWEATSQVGKEENPQGFAKYKDELFNRAVNELGINRLRLELRSNVETSHEMWEKFQSSQGDDQRRQRYLVVNDNADPFKIDWKGFHFDDVDERIDDVVLPMKKLLEARGEKLYVNLNYVNFKGSPLHKESPEEYAELIQATFLHINSKYHWVPDAVEIILEADNAKFSGLKIAQSIVATAKRLDKEGFHPDFIAPSTTSMGKAVPWLQEMAQVPDVFRYLKEFSYHRYFDSSEENLKAIADLAIKYKLNTSMLEHISSSYQDLHQDLTVGNVSAWQQYTLAYPAQADNGGHYYRIIKTDPGHPKIEMGSRTRFLRQYFHFIRRGAVRIGARTDDRSFDPIAFINKNGGYVVVVKADHDGSISINGLPPGMYGTKYTTKEEYDIDLPEVDLTQGQPLNARIPDRGAITIYAKKK